MSEPPDNPGARGLWPRAPARVVAGTLQHASPPALYDPFAPAAPMPEAETRSHGLTPWDKHQPLLVDALLFAVGATRYDAEEFAGAWGILTAPGDTEPLVAFARAVAEFHFACRTLLDTGTLPEEQLAPRLAHIHPAAHLRVFRGPARWAFATLLDAAYFQLVCLLWADHALAECRTPGCGKLFVDWKRKTHCEQNCSAKRRMRLRRKGRTDAP